MKKLIAMLLCVLLVVSMSVTAFATDTGIGEYNPEVKVTITNKNGEPIDPAEIYKVEVAWDGLEFQITADKAEWNTTDLMYDLTNGVLDENESGTVTVTNHSNAAVNVAASFPNNNNSKTSIVSYGITATLSGENGELASAVNQTEAPTKEYTVTPSGTPAAQVPDLTFTVDTIKVTVSVA